MIRGEAAWTRVLIVGKTKMGEQLCLGAIALENGRGVRLLPSSGLGHSLDKPINLGEIWDMKLREAPPSEIQAPHTEDVRTIRGRRVGRYDRVELLDKLNELASAPTIHPTELFNSHIRFTRGERGYVSPTHGLPQYSTGFWRFRKPLLSVSGDDATRFWYFDDDGTMLLDVKYVGLDKDVPDMLAPGTMLRFSLAHPFADDPHRRCYLQLSGWFL